MGLQVEGSGAGAVLIGLDGFKTEHALRFRFQATNNAAEYEALIYGLKVALELKAQNIRVFSDSQLVINQSNGQVESGNKIILRGLKACVLATDSNWVDELNKVLWSCRTTPSSATKETPFSLAYRAEAVIPVEIDLSPNRPARCNDSNNKELLRENLDLVEEVREISQMKNMAYQSRVARFYNKRVHACQFQVDDLVLRKAGLTNAYSRMGKLAPN
ncbi:hypothetical protein SLEP1_g26385 [Rubroshorea leprosula]|uniref:RNase H type-1 domain-containing protein n=1 Tax=Rubroshorea leprosula TaxID=152421 RepID=A0AAV5JLJ8_9ROSI|nr:hypothetical protein SLEP1_g26385 [Rubroshorea leprosula]